LILLDTSGLLAWVDGSQHRHAEVAGRMASAEAPYLLSPFVLAELDYLLAARVGARAQHAVLGEVAGAVYRLEPFSASDVERALAVMETFRDLGIGLADASIVVLAERYRARDLLTLDERHFRALRTRDGLAFRLLPADV
jgi:predicted nucleic acid-binding protein